ncbi:unnamed protein product [Dovyalis caffra]|uniref:Uncharacterized protein n=1 Tax=Dovyalis caffra TaxID=77055 RepID=A0AAV1R8W7_9ROSI|nr:unnamed protein product [Dovyalis caffra]
MTVHLFDSGRGNGFLFFGEGPQGLKSWSPLSIINEWCIRMECMPFPPPGYVWNGVKGEALIELIKVRREKAEVEKQRKKEEKKKEKRRQKMEEGEMKKKRHSYDRKHTQHWREDGNERRDYEFQGIERTSPSEELKQPSTLDSLYESFDTSQSAKRKRPESCHNNGSIVWIDIRLQEHEDQELVFGKPVCSITAMDFLVQEKSELPNICTKEQFFSTWGESTTTALELDRPGVELFHSWPQTELVRDDGKAELALISRYSGSGSERPEIENLEWLYKTKPERLLRSDYTEISSASNDKWSYPICSLYPTAQYLAQADIYALPFTIPF